MPSDLKGLPTNPAFFDDGVEAEKPPTQPHHYCLLCVTFFLVIITVVGPIYAFTVVSCVSTGSCRIVGLLGLSTAACAEGAGEQSQYLMHGEKCTVVCPAGLVPTVPVLKCNDGVTVGADKFKCRPPAPPRPSGSLLGGLVKGAITGGEIVTACKRARSLKCKGSPGGTAILMQFQHLMMRECEALLSECRGMNAEFEWLQFTADPNTTPLPANYYGPVDPATGVCSIGCYNELPPPLITVEVIKPVVGNMIFAGGPLGQLPPPKLCGGPLSASVPICLNVSGSCNPGDNGDYYRQLNCASGYLQWALADKSHRIRYDRRPVPGQGGKWILEGGISPLLNTYGDLSARQDTFDTTPILYTSPWTVQCRTQLSFNSVQIKYQFMQLSLGPCSCTREVDCNGRGRAVGVKTYGPDCRCLCDVGWAGTQCTYPLCKTPQIFRAKEVACAEGDWIRPGQKCTAQCEKGYKPTFKTILCLNDASAFSPPIFHCNKEKTVASMAEVAAARYGATKPTPGPCKEFDCSFRGKPTGERRADGSCVCKCINDYVSNNCRVYAGVCPAPFQVENGAVGTLCVEGTTVPTICTAKCAKGFWPVPSVLKCTPGTNKLNPPTFKCFGGASVAEQWCTLMQQVSLGMSGFTGLILLLICVYQIKPLGRITSPFSIKDTYFIDVEKDETGEHYVVHCEGNVLGKFSSHLPPRVLEQQMNCDLQSGTNHIDATQNDDYREAKQVLANQRYRKEHHHHHHHRPTTTPEADSALPGLQAKLRDIAGDTSDRPATTTTFGDRPATTTIGEAIHEADTESSFSTEPVSPKTGKELAIGLPGAIPPEEIQEIHMGWHLQYHAADEECQRKRYEEAHDAASKNISQEQKHAIEEEARIEQVIEDTTQERSDAEDAVQAALRAGDGEQLRKALDITKDLLKRLEGVPASVSNMLVRLSKIGEGRYLQYFEKNDRNQAHQDWLDRVRSGKAADWHMTTAEFWKYAEDGNLNAVNAGLKAFLPLFARDAVHKDGKRLTVLHMAVKPAFREAEKFRMKAEAAEARSVAAAAAMAAALAAPRPDSPSFASAGGTQPGGMAGGAEAGAGGPQPGGAESAAGADAGAGGPPATVMQDLYDAGEAMPSGYGGVRPGTSDTNRPGTSASARPATSASAATGASSEFFGGDVAGPETAVEEPALGEDEIPSEVYAAAQWDIKEIERNRLEAEKTRLAVIVALLKGKAAPNMTDAEDRTAFDLAAAESGGRVGQMSLQALSRDHPMALKLRDLGLRTAKEARKMCTEEDAANELAKAMAGSRLSGNTVKPQSKGPNPRTGSKAKMDEPPVAPFTIPPKKEPKL